MVPTRFESGPAVALLTDSVIIRDEALSLIRAASLPCVLSASSEDFLDALDCGLVLIGMDLAQEISDFACAQVPGWARGRFRHMFEDIVLLTEKIGHPSEETSVRQAQALVHAERWVQMPPEPHGRQLLEDLLKFIDAPF